MRLSEYLPFDLRDRKGSDHGPPDMASRLPLREGTRNDFIRTNAAEGTMV